MAFSSQGRGVSSARKKLEAAAAALEDRDKPYACDSESGIHGNYMSRLADLSVISSGDLLLFTLKRLRPAVIYPVMTTKICVIFSQHSTLCVTNELLHKETY